MTVQPLYRKLIQNLLNRQKQNKIDLREVCEPPRLSNPHKPLFSLKPLDTKPPIGRCYILSQPVKQPIYFEVIQIFFKAAKAMSGKIS